MKGKIILMLLIIVTFFSLALFAQGGQPVQTTEYNFDDDIVEGDLVRPDGELALARKKGRQSSLIRVRTNFVPELLKSVEDL